MFILVPRGELAIKLFIDFLIPKFRWQNSVYLLSDFSVLKSDHLRSNAMSGLKDPQAHSTGINKQRFITRETKMDDTHLSVWQGCGEARARTGSLESRSDFP